MQPRAISSSPRAHSILLTCRCPSSVREARKPLRDNNHGQTGNHPCHVLDSGCCDNDHRVFGLTRARYGAKAMVTASQLPDADPVAAKPPVAVGSWYARPRSLGATT